jgi:hypothetical protein
MPGLVWTCSSDEVWEPWALLVLPCVKMLHVRLMLLVNYVIATTAHIVPKFFVHRGSWGGGGGLGWTNSTSTFYVTHRSMYFCPLWGEMSRSCCWNKLFFRKCWICSYIIEVLTRFLRIFKRCQRWWPETGGSLGERSRAHRHHGDQQDCS